MLQIEPASDSMATRTMIRGPRSRLAFLLLPALWLAAAWSGWADPSSGLSPGSPAPNFALTTQQNDRLWLTQLRGRAVVLAFGCTTCGACPDVVTRLQGVARGLGDAPGRRVFFALVTVDPARDSPTVLREFGRAHDLRAPAWILLTEDRPGQTDVVARRFGIDIRRAGGRTEASCTVTFIDGGGVIRARYDPGSLEALAADLRTTLQLPPTP
jgi:cytochrome oxidase Cu insertion factor (SCO1/SenC/PrrC family)